MQIYGKLQYHFKSFPNFHYFYLGLLAVSYLNWLLVPLHSAQLHCCNLFVKFATNQFLGLHTWHRIACRSCKVFWKKIRGVDWHGPICSIIPFFKIKYSFHLNKVISSFDEKVSISCSLMKLLFETVGQGLPLTTPLTASQELAKEIQRQDLSQRIPFKNK